MFMVNDLPSIDPLDTLETCVEFKTGKQFKSQTWIDERTTYLNDLVKGGEDPNILLELIKYRVGDDNIKEKCANEEWSNAFVHLLMKYYNPNKIVISCEDENESCETLTNVILKNFKITKNEKDRLLFSELKNIYNNIGCLDSYKKFLIELKVLGCKEYNISGKRGLKFIKLIEELDPENNN
jgi:hypothetical protein